MDSLVSRLPWLLAAASCLVATPSPGGAEEPNELRAVIEKIRNDDGTVGCLLFASAKGFPGKPKEAMMRVRAKITKGRAECVFKAVPKGRYAVSVLHDENGNQRMDTNFFGIPQEGYGASRNAKGTMGPPDFDDAAFTYDGGSKKITLAMRY